MSKAPKKRDYAPGASGPLRGVRVLDLSRLFAGNILTQMLADFGAEVIKVETPEGDTLRAWKTNGVPVHWKLHARSKKSLCLDLRKPEARALLLRLLPSSSLFIESFRPGTLEKMELAPATLLGAMSRQESSFRHVPELADLEGRLATKLGVERTRELVGEGAAFGLDAAAMYAAHQIEVARRDPRPRTRDERPGGLSRRELEVLRLLASGRASAEIATELFISTRTAEHHIQNIYTKVGVSNRASATRWAVSHHVVAG